MGKMLGQEKYVLDIKNLDYNTLISKIEDAWNNKEKIKKDLEYASLGIESIDSLIDYVLLKSYERGLMIYKYFKDMLEALKEMHRLLDREGYLILVVGDNKVLGKKVNTYRLLADATVNTGFSEIVILKDTIRSRSMMTKRNGTGGLIKNEYVAILKKEA